MGARTDLATDLTEAFPLGVKVSESADGATPEPGIDVLAVASSLVEPSQWGGASRRAVTLEVIVAVAETIPGTADDQLDAFLEAVLDVLDEHAWAVWTNAKRATYLDAFPAYVITITKET